MTWWSGVAWTTLITRTTTTHARMNSTTALMTSTTLNAKLSIKITIIRINTTAVVASKWIIQKTKAPKFYTNRVRSFTKRWPSNADCSARWRIRVGKSSHTNKPFYDAHWKNEWLQVYDHITELKDRPAVQWKYSYCQQFYMNNSAQQLAAQKNAAVLVKTSVW